MKDFNDIAIQRGTSGVIEELNQSIQIDKTSTSFNKMDMSDDNIKNCLTQLSKEIDLKIPEDKSLSLEKGKTLKSLEREIF